MLVSHIHQFPIKIDERVTKQLYQIPNVLWARRSSFQIEFFRGFDNFPSFSRIFEHQCIFQDVVYVIVVK